MERYGFRDAWISGLHREFGCDCLMMDIDFLAIEYLGEEPTALVEYKYAVDVDMFKASNKTKVINKLACNLPTFLVVYKHQYQDWHIHALNDQGIGYLGGASKTMTAYDYAVFLNEIRGLNLSEQNKAAIFMNIQTYIENNQMLANEIERNFYEH